MHDSLGIEFKSFLQETQRQVVLSNRMQDQTDVALQIAGNVFDIKIINRIKWITMAQMKQLTSRRATSGWYSPWHSWAKYLAR